MGQRQGRGPKGFGLRLEEEANLENEGRNGGHERTHLQSSRSLRSQPCSARQTTHALPPTPSMRTTRAGSRRTLVGPTGAATTGSTTTRLRTGPIPRGIRRAASIRRSAPSWISGRTGWGSSTRPIHWATSRARRSRPTSAARTIGGRSYPAAPEECRTRVDTGGGR